MRRWPNLITTMIRYIPYLNPKYKTMNKPTKEQALEKLNELNADFEKKSKELQAIIENADKPRSIIERVFDIPSAIAELGESDEDVKEYRKLQDYGFSPKLLLEKEITMFAKAINEGIEISWLNLEQRKYYLCLDFSVKPTNSDVVWHVLYGCYCSHSVSSRHVYKNESLANHAKKCIVNKYYEYYK